ncbi:MAG: hypothetical protein ACI8QS_003705, partial [Planctomycetota bacterium]
MGQPHGESVALPGDPGRPIGKLLLFNGVLGSLGLELCSLAHASHLFGIAGENQSISCLQTFLSPRWNAQG